MTTSLRDQLMQLGFKAPEPPKRDGGQRTGLAKGKPSTARDGKRGDRQQGKNRQEGAHTQAAKSAQARSAEEIDLARAYALRNKSEREQQQREERERQAEAARRREARQKLHVLLKSSALNAKDAELPRHFEHAGKIRRVYVTADQLRALNSGELAVISAGGGYHLLSRADAEQAEAILPGCVALRVEPGSTEGGDDYADPRFAVPDDLVW
jgi:uncharacterized protein YaiL (DUF2058 family)